MPAWCPDVKCACVSPDELECIRIRYGRTDRYDWDDYDESCGCTCHINREDEDFDEE